MRSFGFEVRFENFQFFSHDVIGYAKLVQDLRGDVVLVFQDGQQEVLRTDDFTLEYLSFKIGDLQCLFSLFGKWDVVEVAYGAGIALYGVFYRFA